MNNETKRDVFKGTVETVHVMDGAPDDYCKELIDHYDTALPDDLPTILECVSKEIKAEYGKYSLLDELAWANQDALPSSKVSEWINDNETLFAEAWSRGLWVVKETGEVTSYDN